MDLPIIGLQAIFDQPAVGISQISLDGEWLLVNNRYCQMLGYSEAELRTKTLRDITHPDDFAEALAGRHQLLEGLISSHSMEKRYIRKDGTVFWGRLHRSLVRDHDNLPRFFVAMLEDITQKKQAENALRDSEEALRMSQQRLELAQAAGGIATWDWDIEANETRCSREYGRLYGLPTADFAPPPGKWSQLIHPEDRERVREELSRALDGTAHYNTEFRVVWPDGTVHWLFGKGEVLRDSSGKAIRMLGVNMDVSERKFAEQTLRESEERFRNMADTAPVMIWVSGRDKLCTFFNKPWLDFTGHTMDQELGNGWASGVHPDDIGPCLGTYSSSFDARHSFQMQYRIRRADGEYRWVLDNGMPRYRAGEFVGFIGSCVDITEQKLIEERLRASEARLMNAQRLARVGSWERNIETDTIDWSDEMLRILGVSNKPPSTLPAFLNHVHLKDREKILEADANVRSSSAAVDLEYRIVRPDGEARFVHSIVEAIRDDQGVPIRITGATQDITDFRRAQEESFARQKLESVGTLASGIAHDFNNILGGVLAQAELALQELATGSDPGEELKGIRELAIRGSEIVRELMVYARKEESEVSGLVDTSKIVEEILGLLKVSISKHATLQTDLARDLPPVRGSAAQLRRIVMNLVTNASEALGDRDGLIRVTTRCVAVGRGVTITENLAERDCLQLEVSDTGCGMTQETQARVFDPFFTTKSAGHGLGLAVVDGIVRSLAGTIHLASELGRGTTIQVLLPCAETVAGSSTDSMSDAEKSARRSQEFTVLVVEDEDLLRHAVVKMLRKAGFEVAEAANGSAAIDLLCTTGGKIDVILLDSTIPGSSSQEVVAKAAKALPDVRVILTSAYSQEIAVGAMGAPQISGFIRKPFQFADLLSTLRRALLIPTRLPARLANTAGPSFGS